MRNKRRVKKSVIITSIVILSVIIAVFASLFIYNNFIKEDFKILRFTDEVEYSYQQEIKYNTGKVCYGNNISCHNAKAEVTKKLDTENKTVGEYKVTYTYKYKDHTLNKEQTIKIVDKEKPVIEVEDKIYEVCPNTTTVNIKATANDEYDGDISDKITEELKDNYVIFSVKDSSGNTTTLSKEVKIIDSKAPKITLNGAQEMYVELNSTYKEPGAKATDNCEGDLTNKIVITGEVNTKKVGEYQVKYTVEDSSKNKQTAVRNVYVHAKNNYSAPSGKSIYLTFDDGPGPYTAKLLDILKKYDVKATFFVTDQAITKGYDDVILRAYKEGHTIGLHTNTHDYSIYKNEETYFNDLYAIQNKVKKITGYTSTIIRFPGGSSNTISRNYDGGNKIMSKLTKAVESKGFRYWDWNVSSGDTGTTNTSQISKSITNSLGNSSTYVVLQHDIKGYSVNAVEEVIKYGLSHGYTFRALTMDSPTVHHGVNN